MTRDTKSAITWLTTAGSLPRTFDFDVDYFPIGEQLRAQLVRDGYAMEEDGIITPTRRASATIFAEDGLRFIP